MGMNLFACADNGSTLSEYFDDWVDVLLANGFTEIRVGIPDYATGAVAVTKAAIAIAVGKGAKVIWGVGASYTGLTAANYEAYRTAVKAAADWAEDNGVFEFQIGNEEEAHNDDDTLTDTQLITNLKSLATEVQAIFTNGNVSYTTMYGNIAAWISGGKGDLDFLAWNCYKGGGGVFSDTTYKNVITNLINAFGVDGTYLTELGLSYTNLDDYDEDEEVQAADLTVMIDYIKDSGIKRASYFCFYDDSRQFGPAGFGALKTDKETYRLLWNSLINSDK